MTPLAYLLAIDPGQTSSGWALFRLEWRLGLDGEWQLVHAVLLRYGRMEQRCDVGELNVLLGGMVDACGCEGGRILCPGGSLADYYEECPRCRGGGMASILPTTAVVIESQFYGVAALYLAALERIIRGGKPVYSIAKDAIHHATQLLDIVAYTALTESRCYWEAACISAGAQVELAAPRKWIRRATKGAPGHSPKARIKATCEKRWPDLHLELDEYDAVLLGADWVWLLEGVVEIGEGVGGEGERG